MQTCVQFRDTSASLDSSSLSLRPGLAVRIRQRTASVVEVQRHGPRGRVTHLVTVAYLDGVWPETEALLWEVEADGHLAQSLSVDASGRLPVGRFLDAGVELQRRNLILFPGFSALGPKDSAKAPASQSDSPQLSSPLSVALTPLPPDPHQTVPLEKALEKRRVRLLLADEPGLGKTCQAALVAHELLLRRRAHRILILCPPGLRSNWQSEMKRFAELDFDLLDQSSQPGPACSTPWLSTDRAIASYYWLRRPDVLKGFLAAQEESGPAGPWDLLIVDEAHHLVPPAGSTSQLHLAISQLVGWFPHRLFLTATPHSGYTDSVMGLLQLLDPLRFSRTQTPTSAMRQAMKEVVVRRTRPMLGQGGSLPAKAQCSSLTAPLSDAEQALWRSWERMRKTLTSWTAGDTRCGPGFALGLQVLQKRLLSSLPAFASSFRALQRSVEQGSGTPEALLTSDGEDDGDLTWAGCVAPLQRLVRQHALPLEARLASVDQALGRALERTQGAGAKLATLGAWAARQVGRKPHERLLVFSEFADTVHCAVDALAAHGLGTGMVAGLDASVGTSRRTEVLRQFADPESPLRVLVTTDLASEGLNLHRMCRAVVHLDLPWNPGRLAQRTGRVLRRGQHRPVFNLLLTTETPAEKLFMQRIHLKSRMVMNDVGASADGHLQTAALEVNQRPTQRSLPLIVEETEPSVATAQPAVCQDPIPSRGVRWAEEYRQSLGEPKPISPLQAGSWCVARLPRWDVSEDRAALLALARYLALDCTEGWLLRWVVPLWFGVCGLPFHPRIGPPSSLCLPALAKLRSMSEANLLQDAEPSGSTIPPSLLLPLELALTGLQQQARLHLERVLMVHRRHLLQQEHTQIRLLLQEVQGSLLANRAQKQARTLSSLKAFQNSRGFLFSQDRAHLAQTLSLAEAQLVSSNRILQQAQQCARLDPGCSPSARKLQRARTTLIAPPVLALEGLALLLPAHTEVVP